MGKLILIIIGAILLLPKSQSPIIVSGVRHRQRGNFGASESGQMFVRQCAWCHQFLDKENRYIPKPRGQYKITHGMCPKCYEAIMNQIKAKKSMGGIIGSIPKMIILNRIIHSMKD